MRYGRIFAAFLLVAGLLASAHLAAQQPPAQKAPSTLPPPATKSTVPPSTLPPPATPPAKATTPPPEPVKADPDATRTLDEAVKTLEKNPIQWFKADLWQQAEVQGLLFQCDGLFVYGPNYKLRLDLNLRAGDSVNRSETYCDGNTRWEVRREAGRKPEVRRVDWAKVNQVLNQPGVQAPDRDQILSGLGFSGLLPLLKSLRQDFTLTKQEKARWNDRDVFKLTGVWKSDVIRVPIPAAQWPGALPRQCVLFLDQKTSFPYRLEWWGPPVQGAPDSILMQLEFRNPTLNVVMSPERVAQVFRYQAGEATVQDVTEQLVSSLQNQFDRKRAAPKTK